jgi:L-threonylcarbamoyladenylate synthase
MTIPGSPPASTGPGPTAGTERLQAEGDNGAAGIERAAELLRAGGLVAFPTETVYGLGANALDPVAVAKIFAAKERPAWDPLIVHLANLPMLEQVVSLPAALRSTAETLMRAFWPGPLTLLLPRSEHVPDAVTAGRALVGVRIPAHPIARQLILRAGLPIAAPSANRFGRPSPTTVAHVLQDLDGRIDAVLDAGPANVGVESTVLDVEQLLIYRPGAVTADMISSFLGREARVFVPPAGESPPGESVPSESAPESRPSPGLGMRHYAPRARLILVEDQAEMSREIARWPANQVGAMLPDGWDPSPAGAVFRWGPWDNADILARLLFAGLRSLDERGVQVIVCPLPRMGGLGEALRDRLGKAVRSNGGARQQP